MCYGQPVSSHSVSDMPSYWYSGLVLLCMALQNCLGFLHCIKLNPLKYFTPFPGPFSVLPGGNVTNVHRKDPSIETVLLCQLIRCLASPPCTPAWRKSHGSPVLPHAFTHALDFMSPEQCGFDARGQHCSFVFELLFYRAPQAGLLCSHLVHLSLLSVVVHSFQM